MNPEWNTPPNGDFASYVERLTAKAALPKRQHQEGGPGLDVGMTPHSESYGAGTATGLIAVATAAAAAQRRLSSNGDLPTGAHTRSGAMVAKIASAVGLFALLLMWQGGVPVAVLIALLAGGSWIAFKLRGLKLPQGAAQWQKMLQDAAQAQAKGQERTQREQQGRSK